MSQEKTTRSVIKAITYRILSIVLDTIIAYLITKDAAKTFLLVIISNTLSIIAYFLHERAWNTIDWGKKSDKNCDPRP